MPRLGRKDALGLLRTMWLIRLFEERVGQLKRADEVFGLIHLSVGQEGVAAAVCSQLRDDDAVYSGHRAHGHALAKGAPLERVLAELMGRADGLCGGLGGSMHLVDAEHGLMGATGVVGGNVPLALGSALAARLEGSDQVAVVFFGDGAVQAGHFNESVNLAALWGLPVIFVCENNGFAEFTPRSAHTNVERVSDVVAPYGVDARHRGRQRRAGRVGRLRAASSPRRARARGPLLLECLTHRLRGHYEGDPAHYREALAAEDWQEKDPILRFQRHGVDAGWCDERRSRPWRARRATRWRRRWASRARARRRSPARSTTWSTRPPPPRSAGAARGAVARADHLPQGDQRDARRGDARRRAACS